MNPDEIEELIALDSVGALEPEERRHLGDALAANPEWQAHADRMREISAGLAWCATPEKPSDECRRRILRAIGQRAASETPAPISPGWNIGWLPWAVAAVVLVMASYIGLHSPNKPRQFASAAPQVVLMHLRAAQSGSPAFADVVWDCSTGCGSFCAQRLPRPPQGHCYQIWVMRAGNAEPVNGGVFHTDATGTADLMVHPEEPVKAAAKILVSLEIEGGVKKAQGPVVLESI